MKNHRDMRLISSIWKTGISPSCLTAWRSYGSGTGVDTSNSYACTRLAAMLQHGTSWLQHKLRAAKAGATVKRWQALCVCSCLEHDKLVKPVSKKPWNKLAKPKRTSAQRNDDSPAAPVGSSTRPHMRGTNHHKVAQPRHVSPPVSSEVRISSPGPAYGTVPLRSDIPPARNELLQLPDRKPPQQSSKSATAHKDPQPAYRQNLGASSQSQRASSKKQPARNSSAAPPQTHQQHGGPANTTAPQPSNKPQERFQTRPERREYDPGRAFMRAGMPNGLWVLPLEASCDGPPAPPPVAPEDPQELLKVLQSMPAPRRKLVIFKAGGYIYSDMEAMIEQAGLSHVMRMTNLIRKANCVLAKPVWDNGKRVNLRQHQAAAEKARVPFLIINKMEPVELVAAVRPLLIKRKTVVE